MPKSVYSADDLPANRRLDYWRGAISEAFVRLDCTSGSAKPFRGRVASSTAGDLLISHVDTAAQNVHRTRPLIRADGADVFLISFQLTGRGVVDQDGRQAVLHAGNFALYDSTRPYSLHFDGDFEQLVLHMPRRVLNSRLGRCDTLTARTVGGNGPVGHMAGAFISGLPPALAALRDERAERLGRIALDLVSVAFSELADCDPTERSWASEGIARRAKAIMTSRLHDPDLSTSSVAAALGISPRRLQEALAREGTSPTRWLWRCRLQRARELLEDSTWASATIGEIAYATGFSDASHFSHRFRARFGVSPREWRAKSRSRPI